MFLCPKCCSDKNISELQQLWSVESYQKSAVIPLASAMGI